MNIEQLVQDTIKIFPWYQQLLKTTNADIKQLQTLPLMTEDVLTQHYYHTNHAMSENYHTYLTSGTTSGKRKKIHYSDNDQRIYLQQRIEIIRKFCGKGNIRACVDLGTGHAAATAKDIFHAIGCEVELINFTLPIQQHVEILNRFKPDILFTMPMILDCLIATGQLDFQPKKIIVLGDVASMIWQKKVADYFHITLSDILDLFGSIEIGSIAFYNHHLGCYQFDLSIIPEVLSPQEIYPDVSYHGNGHILLLTSFAREYFPAVRFVTNDLLEGFASHMDQGKTIYTYQRCLGRFASEYKHGEKISLNDINAVMAVHLPYHQYDLDDQGGALSIRIVAESISSATIQAIKHDLLSRNLDVAQMIKSGLVGDIRISCVDAQQISSNISKRRY